MIRRLRVLWRRARAAPVLGPALRALDVLWWERTISRAGLVDIEFVRAQLGREISSRAAVRAYVRGGFRAGLSLTPLMCEATIRRQLPDPERVPALYAYLVNDKGDLQVSPHWDAPNYLRHNPESSHNPAGPPGHVWSLRAHDPLLPLGPGDQPLDVALSRFRHTAIRGASTALDETSPTAGIAADGLLVAVDGDDPDIDLALADAGVSARTWPAELVLGVQGGAPAARAQAALLTLWVPGAHVFSVPEGAVALREIADRSSATGVVLAQDATVRLTSADARRLRSVATGTVLVPLWLQPDGTLVGLEEGGPGGRVLAGHPREDVSAAEANAERILLARPSGAVVVAPASAALPALRALKPSSEIAPVVADEGGRHGLPAAVFTGSVAWAHATVPALPDAPLPSDALAARTVEGAGFAQTGNGRLTRPARTVSVGGVARPSLRWSIRTAAPAGPRGESWGDTHFARGIADALRRLGQEVVIDAYPARNRPTTYLDDVTLVLRGPRRIEPPVTGRSLLWVISHPDEITADEAAPFASVFAASTKWASSATRRWQRSVEPLLQCTDAARFRPHGLPRTSAVVFVGTARGIARPSVVEPLRAGIPVGVYGPDWRGFIPGSAIVAPGIANSELPALYESAAAVLNDHWPAMQAEGFISNRSYDVVAAGGRVISDHVSGMGEVFGGAALTYREVPELLRILRSDLDALFPPPAELAAISARIRAEESFDARARFLLSRASQL